MIRIDDELLNVLMHKAALSERQRTMHCIHREDADILQRMLNVLEPDTYCRPHKHITPVKRELFIIIKGKAAIVEFNDDGSMKEFALLSPGSGVYGTEITPGSWHTLVCFDHGTVLFEVKDGPYDAAEDKIFAPWSPEENNEESLAYLKKMKKAMFP